MRNYACTCRQFSCDLTAKHYCQHTLLQRLLYTKISPLSCYDYFCDNCYGDDCYGDDCYGDNCYGDDCYKDLAIILLQLLLLRLLRLPQLRRRLLRRQLLRRRLLRRRLLQRSCCCSSTTILHVHRYIFSNICNISDDCTYGVVV